MVTNIISAKEANDLTTKEIQNDDSDLVPIMETIQKAIKRKEYYCHLSAPIERYTIDKLRRLGYGVEFCDGGGNQREPDFYKISWDMTNAFPN